MSNNASSFLDLQDGEIELDDPDELHYRQCHPSFFVDGQPSSQLYGDFEVDEGQLSGTRSKYIDAQDSYKNHVASGRESVGTWALSVSEVRYKEPLSRLVDDIASPLPVGVEARPTGHTYLDQQHLSTKERQKLRRRLIKLANVRGCMFETSVIADPALPGLDEAS